MNIEEIDKWLDNEYGCSYTRLEELHDFVVDQDLKHRDEIERLNNIIKEFKMLIENEINESKLEDDYDRADSLKYCLATLKELLDKGE